MTALPKHSRTVLVVDDISQMRSLVGAVLESSSTRVLKAPDGKSALELAREHLPDVILLDLAMPGIGGVEVLQQLRSMPETQGIPVVIVTALAHSDLAEMAMALGANDLVEKPFRPVELRSVVDKWTAPPGIVEA